MRKPLVIEFLDEAQTYIEAEAAQNNTSNEEVVRKMLNLFIVLNKPEIDILAHNHQTGETRSLLISYEKKI
jgi:spore cortex formation protein SpoVR/YcgB (stage V sporulation)